RAGQFGRARPLRHQVLVAPPEPGHRHAPGPGQPDGAHQRLPRQGEGERQAQRTAREVGRRAAAGIPRERRVRTGEAGMSVTNATDTAASAGMPAVRMQGVEKWYSDFHALKNIDLEVARGEKIVVCGPSGSGKSTLI